MIQIKKSDLDFMQNLIDSLQYELCKAKDNGGFIDASYVSSKASKVLQVVLENSINKDKE